MSDECNKGYKCVILQFCFSVTFSKSNMDKEDNKLTELKLDQGDLTVQYKERRSVSGEK